MPQTKATPVARWFEIPVTDMARSMEFYGAVAGAALTLNEDGPNPIALFARSAAEGGGGHIYPGKPAPAGTGPTIHLAVDNVEAAMARLTKAGGKIVTPVIEIPAGRFAYCLDLDGNSIGLFSV
jgi:predicted enzyme related to lactoylglutathione lyase